MFSQKDNRSPSTCLAILESRVDTVRFRTHFIEKLSIALDIRAAGCANLHKCKTSLICWIQFQKTLDAAKALDNSFGVIHTVYAYAQQAGFNAQLRAQCGTLFTGVTRVVDSARLLRKRNADRIRPHARNTALTVHRKAIPFSQCLHRPIYG